MCDEELDEEKGEIIRKLWKEREVKEWNQEGNV